MKVKVGCCGFPVGMGKYYDALETVEVNVTFYKYPSLKLLAGWRKKAPESFEFTVKAHQDLSHKLKLEWGKEAEESLKRMKEICEALKAEILLVQTPGSLKPTEETFRRAEKFFKEARKQGLTLVWEPRGEEWFKPETKKKLKQILAKADVIHCVDPFLDKPVYTSEIAYFRLHGLGEKMYYYEYSNEELKQLKAKVSEVKNVKEVYVFFNNLSMFNDALRFKAYLEKGKFPPLSGFYGIEALKKILEKTRFPISRKTLIEKFGWRLIEVKPGKQVTLKSIFAKLSEKNYESLDELAKRAEEVLAKF